MIHIVPTQETIIQVIVLFQSVGVQCPTLFDAILLLIRLLCRLLVVHLLILLAGLYWCLCWCLSVHLVRWTRLCPQRLVFLFVASVLLVGDIDLRWWLLWWFFLHESTLLWREVSSLVLIGTALQLYILTWCRELRAYDRHYMLPPPRGGFMPLATWWRVAGVGHWPDVVLLAKSRAWASFACIHPGYVQHWRRILCWQR